jgi:hypothetical protein
MLLEEILALLVVTGLPLGIAWVCHRKLRANKMLMRIALTYFFWDAYISWALMSSVYLFHETKPISQQMPLILVMIPIFLLWPVGYIVFSPFLLLGFIRYPAEAWSPVVVPVVTLLPALATVFLVTIDRTSPRTVWLVRLGAPAIVAYVIALVWLRP